MIKERIFLLPENYIENANEEVFILVKYANFSWVDVKLMTISERKFYISKLIEYNKKQMEEK